MIKHFIGQNLKVLN